eukprot:TRINITY_DN2491_c0_g1_i1.p1 TRINITY_DN2491_c0_g1~~TRINITY_DN2491_c0_g1_i1.p1  ORF type:complete len:113 (+),score=21.24 TRINITY_DN2491_c0_g1_i1:278-616(+)
MLTNYNPISKQLDEFIPQLKDLIIKQSISVTNIVNQLQIKCNNNNNNNEDTGVHFISQFAIPMLSVEVDSLKIVYKLVSIVDKKDKESIKKGVNDCIVQFQKTSSGHLQNIH